MKIILVDDEPIICQYILECIRQCGPNYQTIGCFCRAADAIKFIDSHDVDLVITDITMPEIDGLEMASIINEQHDNSIDIVVLTCHQDFNFARQALSKSIKDYIIKSEINPERMKQLLDNIERSHSRNSLKEIAKHYTSTQFLQNYIMSQDNSLLTSEEIDKNKIPLDNLPYFVTVFAKQSSILEQICKYSDRRLINAFFFSNESETKYIFIANVMAPQNEVSILEQCKSQFAEYATPFCNGYIGISEICFDVKYLKNAVLQADFEANMAYYKSSKSTFSNSSDRDIAQAEVQSHANSATAAIAVQDSDKYVSEINNMLNYIENTACISPEYFCFISRYLILSASPILDKSRLDAYIRNIYSASSFEEAKNCLKRFSNELSTRPKYSPPIELAIRYIEANFANNFSLSDISQYVFLSKEYFCRKFKNEVGMTFSEYRLYVQMREAYKMIIGSDENINVIAEKVGMYNISYFSSAFKKQFGSSPRNIRKP